MAANGDSDALMVYPSGRKRLLSTGMVVFLVVSAAAPLTAMAGNMPIGLSFPAGLGMPMAFVVVAAILACFAVGYAELSRAVKGTGAFYTYIGRGLGKPAGVVAAYCAVLAYAAMSVGLAAAFGYFGSVLFDQLGLKVPWMACAVAGLAIIGIMGYLALDFSARALAFFMTAEFLVLAAFDLSVLAAKGWASFPMEVWRPENYVRWDFGAILPFAVTSFIGIEAAALYGEETRRPERSIPSGDLFRTCVGGGILLPHRLDHDRRCRRRSRAGLRKGEERRLPFRPHDAIWRRPSHDLRRALLRHQPAGGLSRAPQRREQIHVRPRGRRPLAHASDAGPSALSVANRRKLPHDVDRDADRDRPWARGGRALSRHRFGGDRSRHRRHYRDAARLRLRGRRLLLEVGAGEPAHDTHPARDRRDRARALSHRRHRQLQRADRLGQPESSIRCLSFSFRL